MRNNSQKSVDTYSWALQNFDGYLARRAITSVRNVLPSDLDVYPHRCGRGAMGEAVLVSFVKVEQREQETRSSASARLASLFASAPLPISSPYRRREIIPFDCGISASDGSLRGSEMRTCSKTCHYLAIWAFWRVCETVRVDC